MIALHQIRPAFICLSILIAICFIIISITKMGIERRPLSASKISTKKYPNFCYNSSSNSIILFHLTNRSNEWKQLEACAFKRAAELNGIGVCILTAIEMRPHHALIGLTNLQFAPLDIKRIVMGTTMHDWYVNTYSNRSAVGQFAMYELSDGLRYAYLYKFGGYYLDTDTITLRNFTHLRNTTGWESKDYVAIGIMFFDSGHPLMKAVLDLIPTSYKPYVWGTFGPELLTNVIRQGNVSNDTYHLLRKELYPTTYHEDILPFSSSSKQLMQNLTEDSYTLHLWRNREAVKDFWKEGAILPNDTYIQEICGDV